MNDDVVDKLRKLMGERLGWAPASNVLAPFVPPFDITRPNIHDSKKDFSYEKETVQEVAGLLDAAFNKLITNAEERTPEFEDMSFRIQAAVEASAKQMVGSITPRTARDIAIKNVADSGFYTTSLLTIAYLGNCLKKRLSELEQQEEEFWSVSHRPPNYYARIIALRFARFYAGETGRKPTFGTSSEGSHPSTDFGRLLEEVFSILDIDANVRRAAEWAIPQITDMDTQSPYAMGGLLGMMTGEVPESDQSDGTGAELDRVRKKGG